MIKINPTAPSAFIAFAAKRNVCNSLYALLSRAWESLSTFFQNLCCSGKKPIPVSYQTIAAPPMPIAPPIPEPDLNRELLELQNYIEREDFVFRSMDPQNDQIFPAFEALQSAVERHRVLLREIARRPIAGDLEAIEQEIQILNEQIPEHVRIANRQEGLFENEMRLDLLEHAQSRLNILNARRNALRALPL